MARRAGNDDAESAALAGDYVIDEEEAYYSAELAQREAALGPAHPGLADALSNLAILHNQRGDYGRAQPLYERALAIYEAAHGRGHPDVAHTLTDLAVLHLEQARARPACCPCGLTCA
jgi:centrosomal protein CEP104